MLTQKKLLAIKNAVSVFDLLDQEKPPKVVFTTQRDNRVDDRICLQLSGIAFDIDDPFRPVIPIDTHPNCRCYYVDESTGEIVTDISSKRIKDRGMPSKKLNDLDRVEELTEHRHYLTQKKKDLIVEYMNQNEKWQKKSKDFIPSDDTGIRPLRYGASLEKMKKWVMSI